MKYKKFPLEVEEGVNPEPDSTESSTPFWTDADKMRFHNGRPRTQGGRTVAQIDSGSIAGCTRTIFSYFYNSKFRYIIGTNQKLYEYINSTLVNITPQKTTTTAIANSLDSYYGTLASNPVTTVSGSKVVTITYSAITGLVHVTGDSVTISGATTTNGVPDTEINATHSIINATATTFGIQIATAATSSGTGGGASVVLATTIFNVNATAHGQLDGDRTTLAGAADTAGVTAATYINIEHIIRNVSTDDFHINLGAKATSSVTSGGGASTTYAVEIADGSCDKSLGAGYGGGLYGAGRYGVSKAFTNVYTPARIWSMDRYGNDIVLTAGFQTGVYLYAGSNITAPVALTNAPTACNWVFEHRNCVCTLGDSGVGNRIKCSDTGDGTDWTPAATSNAFTDDIEGAEDFTTAIVSRGDALLFTDNSVYLHRWVGGTQIRSTKLLTNIDGIIGPNARVDIGGAILWMGQFDFYMYDGGAVRAIPNNTIKKKVFDNINRGQASKSYVWHNKEFNEVWFEYPAATDEPMSVAKLNLSSGKWVIDTDDATAVEYPKTLQTNPLAADLSGNLYRYENGDDNTSSAQTSYIESNYFQIGSGDNNAYLMGYVHDATQTGDMKLTIYSKLRQEATTERTYGPYTLTTTTDKVDFRAHGRLFKVRLEKDTVGASFTLGRPYLKIQEATVR